MHVSHDKKIVWLRVPKTGSTAVINISRGRHNTFWDLQPYDMGYPTHVRMSEIPLPFKERYKDYKWVTAIRHPLTWLPSFYGWVSNNSDYSKQAYVGTLNIPASWPDFISSLKVTPLSWVNDPAGIIENVLVYKQEDMSPLEELLGVKIAARYNESKKLRSLDPDDQLRELIRRKFAMELAHYPNEPI